MYISLKNQLPIIMKVYRKERSELEKYPKGEVLVCPSMPPFETYDNKYYGEKFLHEYSGWGFVKVAKDPDYFALYLSSPVKAIRFFAVLDEIIDPRKEECEIANYEEYKMYSEGKKLIRLEEPLIELNDEIPFEGLPLFNRRYTTLNKFIEAENTSDLW